MCSSSPAGSSSGWPSPARWHPARPLSWQTNPPAIYTAAEISGVLKESAHELDKCVIVVTHSNELAKQADVILKLKRGSLQTVKSY